LKKRRDKREIKTYTFSAPAVQNLDEQGKDREKNNVDASSDKGDFVPANVRSAPADMKMMKRSTHLVEAVPGASHLQVMMKLQLKSRLKSRQKPYTMRMSQAQSHPDAVRGGTEKTGRLSPQTTSGVCTPRPQVRLQEISEADVRIKPELGSAV